MHEVILVKCPNCGYEGSPKTFAPGSLLLEIFLWIFFLVPGVIYSIWRMEGKYRGCPQCQFRYVIRKQEEVTTKHSGIFTILMVIITLGIIALIIFFAFSVTEPPPDKPILNKLLN